MQQENKSVEADLASSSIRLDLKHGGRSNLKGGAPVESSYPVGRGKSSTRKVQGARNFMHREWH
jgi:hypothetical protein